MLRKEDTGARTEDHEDCSTRAVTVPTQQMAEDRDHNQPFLLVVPVMQMLACLLLPLLTALSAEAAPSLSQSSPSRASIWITVPCV